MAINSKQELIVNVITDRGTVGSDVLASPIGIEVHVGTPAKGHKGDKGEPGPGVPPGGEIGEIVGKVGPGDFETGWVVPGAVELAAALSQAALDATQKADAAQAAAQTYTDSKVAVVQAQVDILAENSETNDW